MLAPREPVPFWEGGELPSQGRIVKAASRTVHTVATDYDRACDIGSGAALLAAGNGWIIAVNGEVAEAAWLPLEASYAAVALVGVDSWDEEPTLEEVRSRYAVHADAVWTPLAEALAIGPGGVVLMHAAGIPGQDTEYAFDAAVDGEQVYIGDAITYPLPSGRYRVEQLEIVRRRTKMEPGAYTVLVRFSLQV